MKIFAKRPAPSPIVEFDVGAISEVTVTFKKTWVCGHLRGKTGSFHGGIWFLKSTARLLSFYLHKDMILTFYMKYYKTFHVNF